MKRISNRLLLCVALLTLFQSAAGGKDKQEVQPSKGFAVILIGHLTGTKALVRPDKLAGSVRNLPNGQASFELPLRSAYYVGTIYEFCVHEILNGKKVVEAGQTIKVFVPGPEAVSDRVVPTSERPYLLQLSLLKDDPETYQGMAVMDLGDLSASKQQFDPQTTYVIMPVPHGAIPVTEENKRLIKSIRRDASRH